MHRMFALVLLVAVAACGGAAAGTTTVATTTAAPTASSTTTTTTSPTPPTLPDTGDDLPPFDYETLATLLDPFVAPLGYVTGRATLIDLDVYLATPDGTHLALYFTPTVDKSPDDIAADLPLLARALVPAIFERWPALESMDFCQEPFGWEGETAPPGLTIFDIDRPIADAISWPDADLATLLTVAGIEEGFDVYAQEEIRSSAVWTEATPSQE